MIEPGQLDAINRELQAAIWQMTSKEITQEERENLHARIAELSDRLVAISKRGDAPVFIINLTAKRWIVNRSYSSFWIRGKTDDEPYSVTEIVGRGGKVDTGRGGEPTQDRGWRVKLDSLFWPAEIIAKDIVREINGDLPGLQVQNPSHLQKGKVLKTMGVFISLNRVPDESTLKEETNKLKLYYAHLVQEGDMVWRKTHDYRQISDLNREAVDALGISREWHASLDSIINEDGGINLKGRRRSA